MVGLALSILLSLVLPHDIHLIPGKFVPGSQPDGNTIVLDAPNGLIVIDTGRHVEHTRAIIDYARQRRKTVSAIVNTHWHLDHTGGNLLLRDAFPSVRVYATNAINGALTGFLAGYRKQLEEMIDKTSDEGLKKRFQTEVALIDAGPKLAPDEVVSASGTLWIAGRKIQLNVAKNAATAADIWIFDPKTKVVASGDLVTLPAPFLDTACPRGWNAALDKVAKSDFQILIPGHGEPMKRKQFETYRSAFNDLLECASSTKPQKACVAQWLSDTRTLGTGKDEGFTRSMMNYYVGVLRNDKAKIEERCR